MPTARSHLTTSIVDDKIYAIGGTTNTIPGWPALSVLEVYDPIDDSWKIEKELPVPRIGCHSSIVDDKIYVFGGLDDDKKGLSRVDVYDPKKKTWTQLTDMPTARGELSSVAVKNQIYVMGGIAAVGKRSLGTVEVYNPITDEWLEYTQMPTGRSHMGCVVYKDWIITFGGEERQVDSGDVYPVATVEILNTSTKEWITSTPLTFPRGLLTASIVDGTIYAIGGYTDTVPPWPGLKTVEALKVK
jgi:N-acetylneuraminic acid mutarotase